MILLEEVLKEANLLYKKRKYEKHCEGTPIKFRFTQEEFFAKPENDLRSDQVQALAEALVNAINRLNQPTK